MYNLYLRDLLFKLDPETAHYAALMALNYASKLKLIRQKKLSSPCKIMGIEFPNPVGLAAGLDKNGDYIDALAKLGFGFIEIGTVTPKPQSGNPKPRLFRLPEAQAIINRMGFNNKGVDYLVQRVKEAKYSGVLGINIGKNAITPLENAIDDYRYCLQKVYPYASYITVNISSPNTKDLRQLQSANYLKSFLNDLKTSQIELANLHNKYVPLVVKISPDLSLEEVKQLASDLIDNNIDGVIATNTTINKTDVQRLPHGDEQGGLSGKPLLNQSNVVIAELHKYLKDKIPIIGVGGILSAKDATEKFSCGANLVQLYTGLVYSGTSLIAAIVKNINKS